MEYTKKNRIKAFAQVFVAPSLRVGFHNLMVGAGLGAMTCNTIVFPLLDRKKGEESSTKDSDGEELTLISSSGRLQSPIELSDSGLIAMLDSKFSLPLPLPLFSSSPFALFPFPFPFLFPFLFFPLPPL
jgi:hypothetical protein